MASKETCSGTLLKSETLLYFFRISLYYLIWAAKFSESMKGRILILGLQALLIVDILGPPSALDQLAAELKLCFSAWNVSI